MRDYWQAKIPPLNVLPRESLQTVAQLLERGTAMLRGSISARADAQILLAHVLRRRREWIIACGESIVSPVQAEQFLAMCERRASGLPLAYISGFAGFYGREFAVNDYVLIPRPETEHLVEDALAHLRCPADAPTDHQVRIFEPGVGSGAIACTVAAEIPHAAVHGTDVSAKAIAVANANAHRLGVQTRCTFSVADVVGEADRKPYDVVIANLPYIPSNDVPVKPDPAGFEPRVALDGGPDGLDCYRKLLAAAPELLRPRALLLLEAAPPTIQALRAMTVAALPRARIEVRRDYAGLERYVWAAQDDRERH